MCVIPHIIAMSLSVLSKKTKKKTTCCLLAILHALRCRIPSNLPSNASGVYACEISVHAKRKAQVSSTLVTTKQNATAHSGTQMLHPKTEAGYLEGCD